MSFPALLPAVQKLFIFTCNSPHQAKKNSGYMVFFLVAPLDEQDRPVVVCKTVCRSPKETT
jgi:hypothetical protein